MGTLCLEESLDFSLHAFVFVCVCGRVAAQEVVGSLRLVVLLKESEGECEEEMNSSHTNHHSAFKPNGPGQGCFTVRVLWFTFILKAQKRQMESMMRKQRTQRAYMDKDNGRMKYRLSREWHSNGFCQRCTFVCFKSMT